MKRHQNLTSEVHSELAQTFKIEFFLKKVKD